MVKKKKKPLQFIRYNGLEPEPRCFKQYGCKVWQHAQCKVHLSCVQTKAAKKLLSATCLVTAWSTLTSFFFFNTFAISVPNISPHPHSVTQPHMGSCQHLESWALDHWNCQWSNWDPISLSSYPLWFCFLNYAQILIWWKKRLCSTVLCTRHFLITLPELLLLIST